jgi:HSP20 family molecular chaperone IbpA
MEVRLNDAWMGGRPNQWFVDRVNELIKPPYFGTDTSHEVPAADVIESEDGYHFYFEMPGVKGETISVRLEEGALIVEAERKRPEFSGKTTSHRSERNYRKYHRAFRLQRRRARSVNRQAGRSQAGQDPGQSELTCSRSPRPAGRGAYPPTHIIPSTGPFQNTDLAML